MDFKKVKIVATLGPSTYTAEKILALGEAGVDMFRINFSHAQVEDVPHLVRWIRESEMKLNRTFAILGDLPGPKVRLDDVAPDIVLTEGDVITLFSETVMGSEKGFSINHPEVLPKLDEGAAIYIDDGNIKLVVNGKTPDGISAQVLVGGSLKPRKGFSAEGISLDTPELSEKDKAGIEVFVRENVDFIAVSFVQTAEDILAVKNHLPKESEIKLMVKIETVQGVENAERIMDVADSMMIARGDMGLAIPLAKIPHIQKELIELCIKKAKPVLTATQMLESMIFKPMPTRAEVTDVANAIIDGTDAVMLSAETATGKFPIEAVKTMATIIKETEQYIKPYEYTHTESIDNAISASVGRVAEQIKAKVIVAFTQTGRCARRISRHRHADLIIAASPDEKTIRQLNLSWGVYPEHITQTKGFTDMRDQAKKIVIDNQFISVKTGDPFVIVAGMPFGQTGTTNMIFVEKI